MNLFHAKKSPRCARAKGKRCQCRTCMGAQHGTNPPRTRKLSRTRSRTKACACKLKTVLLGRVSAIEYTHAGGGKYRHTFARGGSRLSVTTDGRLLVVDGAQVKPFIEG